MTEEWKKHIGVGEAQHNDLIVGDTTRTHTTPVLHDQYGRPIGSQTEHRSGRLDAEVTPPCIIMPWEAVREVQEKVGMDDHEMLAALNRIFGTKARRIVNGREGPRPGR